MEFLILGVIIGFFAGELVGTSRQKRVTEFWETQYKAERDLRKHPFYSPPWGVAGTVPSIYSGSFSIGSSPWVGTQVNE